ncbi:MAG: HPP family protein [Thiomicrospira sp.]|uniref:HPP family protein n=1 Tax=Thiomicrospira sp. TaxID=935 RepID=UPI0019E3660E|nr:HPP family protein [Thiomicrospira sp.]MBE0493528.1 HPP family protein [Thiomicrospira sp.]
MKQWIKSAFSFEASHLSELIVSVSGVFIAMIAVVLVMAWVSEGVYAWFVIASVGASAIILFSTPHAPMAQPWAVLAGQMIAGICGLASWTLFKDPMMAVPIAVASTLLFMLLFKARHAPGGATALFIALGTVEVETLGWSLLWLSLLPSLLTLIVMATLFNALFKWRRYPYIVFKKTQPQADKQPEITHEDLVYASEKMQGYFEMSEAEFMQLYRAARQHHKTTRPGGFVCLSELNRVCF